MEWQEKAKVESGIAAILHITKQQRLLKEEKEAHLEKIAFFLKRNELSRFTFEADGMVHEITIEDDVKNKLEKKSLAEHLSIATKDLKTKTMIDKAEKGELTLDEFEKHHVTEVNEKVKLKSKKAKIKKEKKQKKD